MYIAHPMDTENSLLKGSFFYFLFIVEAFSKVNDMWFTFWRKKFLIITPVHTPKKHKKVHFFAWSRVVQVLYSFVFNFWLIEKNIYIRCVYILHSVNIISFKRSFLTCIQSIYIKYTRYFSDSWYKLTKNVTKTSELLNVHAKLYAYFWKWKLHFYFIQFASNAHWFICSLLCIWISTKLIEKVLGCYITWFFIFYFFSDLKS